MRFTRKIPGIRLPVPGLPSEAISDPLAPGMLLALVFVQTLTLLGLYLFCTLRLGGNLALFWLDTRVVGLSLFAVATSVNGMLALFAIGSFLIARHGRRLEWKRVAGTILTLALLSSSQVLLNGWRGAAVRDREQSRAAIDRETNELAERRADLATLADHAWAGEYRGRRAHREVRLLVRPGATGQMFYLDREDRARDAVPAILEAFGFDIDVQVRRDRLVLRCPTGPDSWRTMETYAVVGWGTRRYLVAEGELEGFLTRTVDTAPTDADLSGGLLSLVGDAELPFAGTPEVLRGLPEYR